MVKFGRHLQFYLESDEQSSGAEPFIVPYTDIRSLIGESEEQFVQAWKASLSAASDAYAHSLRSIWESIFEDLSRCAEQQCRGLPLDEATKLYVLTMPEDRSRDLFSSMKRLHSSASMNAEALRKLVKKYDKGAPARGDAFLTSTLLPELYSAHFMGYPTLEPCMETLRDALVVPDEVLEAVLEEGEEEDAEMNFIRQKTHNATKDSNDVKRRAEELAWLHDLVLKVPSKEMGGLVAHRGFHCPRDNSGRRPLENSLAAFETAWSAGVHLCECDVALTKDEKLVLAHDEDFSRLALDPSKTVSKKKIGDLTMKELISLTFKSGTRPPLLLDVLRSAEAIGGSARLVIEVKPGNQEACGALVRMFREHPELIDRCAIIMSFDAYLMHQIKSQMKGLSLELTSKQQSDNKRSASPTSSQSLHEGEAAYEASQIKMPDVLLLTVSDMPKHHYDLQVSVDNVSFIRSCLEHEGKPSLDGVYMQYQPEMLTPQGVESLRELSKLYKVGIWQYFGDLDNLATATHLIRECGCSFVNTDLPRNFYKDQWL